MSKRWLLAAAVLVAGIGHWQLNRDPPGEQPGGGGMQSLPLSARVVPGQDLPPSGTRSLFDHHIAQLGALPYPFERLVESLNEPDRWDNGTVQLLIPDGRSLRKAQADFTQPRVLIAGQVDSPYSAYELAPVYSGRLFMGFVEAVDEIEVISYNEVAGRFEFQLVENYCAGCVPRIVYARRAVCMSCHQSGAPIFSKRPWGETNAHPEIARQIARARGGEWLQASKTRYHAAPLSTQLAAPETFDELVLLGARISVSQRLWIEGCGQQGMACRRMLLASALGLLIEPGEFNPASEASEQLRRVQAKAWPPAGIPVPQVLLENRDPMAGRSFSSDLWRSAQMWFAKLFPTRGQEAGEDPELAAKLAAFSSAPKLSPKLDPLTLRVPEEVLSADSLYGVHGLAKLFSVNDRKLLREWTRGDWGRVPGMVMAGELDNLLQPAPLVRAPVMQQLARLLGQSVPDYCCLDTSQFSPPRSEATPELEVDDGSVLSLYQRYCFACHRGNPVQKLNFMGAGTQSAVLAEIQARVEIRDVLDYERFAGTDKKNKLMPPRGSVQREKLEQALGNGASDLTRMRAAVPTLFDFAAP